MLWGKFESFEDGWIGRCWKTGLVWGLEEENTDRWSIHFSKYMNMVVL